MNRRSISIFNFSFLDWMVGFLGCVIIQLLLAQKSVEQRPCPALPVKVYAYLDTIRGITWAVNPEDIYRAIRNKDSVLAVIVGIKSFPADTVRICSEKPPPIVITGGGSSGNGGQPIILPPCLNCPTYPGLVNFSIEYENPDDRFYLYAKKGNTLIGSDKIPSIPGVEVLWIKAGKKATVGQRIVQNSKIVPGIYEIYAQYWGNRMDRKVQQGSASLYFMSKLKPGSNTSMTLTLPKAKRARDLTPVVKIQVEADGTLQYLNF